MFTEASCFISGSKSPLTPSCQSIKKLVVQTASVDSLIRIPYQVIMTFEILPGRSSQEELTDLSTNVQLGSQRLKDSQNFPEATPRS